MEKGRESGTSSAAYPTCGIRRPELAYENTQSRLLLLANFPEEVYNLRHSPAHHHKGGWILCKEFSSSSRG
jgi:hypothetical protein